MTHLPDWGSPIASYTPEEACAEFLDFLVEYHRAVVEYAHPTAFLVRIPDTIPERWLVTVEDEALMLRNNQSGTEQMDADTIDEAIAFIENEMLPA
jgi:hypothetical protein